MGVVRLGDLVASNVSEDVGQSPSDLGQHGLILGATARQRHTLCHIIVQVENKRRLMMLLRPSVSITSLGSTWRDKDHEDRQGQLRSVPRGGALIRTPQLPMAKRQLSLPTGLPQGSESSQRSSCHPKCPTKISLWPTEHLIKHLSSLPLERKI